jgi:hypothetical protein
MRLEEQLQARESECSELKARLGKREEKDRSIKFDSFVKVSSSLKGSPIGSDGFDSLSDTASIDYNDAASASADVAGSNAGWLQNLDSGSTDSGDNGSVLDVRTEPADLSSRRSIERDALRKYVRKRYLKSKGSV